MQQNDTENVTKKWSQKHSECVRCGSNKTPHHGRGLCKVCHQVERSEIRRKKKQETVTTTVKAVPTQTLQFAEEIPGHKKCLICEKSYPSIIVRGKNICRACVHNYFAEIMAKTCVHMYHIKGESQYKVKVHICDVVQSNLMYELTKEMSKR